MQQVKIGSSLRGDNFIYLTIFYLTSKNMLNTQGRSFLQVKIGSSLKGDNFIMKSS
jgi:hypothetical protein